MVSTRVKDDPPAAPTGLTAGQVTHDSVTLTWTAPSSGSTVTSYRVLRGTDANSLSTIAQDTGNTNVEYTDTTVAAETTYHYAVLALSQDGDGAQSATISAATPAAPQPVPPAPTGLAATPSHDQVSLSWDDLQNSSITGYQIWRGPDSNSLASIQADTGSTTTTYVDDTVTAETAYHYAVSAINSTGTGDQSTTVSATTPAAPQEQESKEPPKGTPVPDRVTRADPGLPQNLAVVAGDAQLVFTWTPPSADGGSAIVRYNHLLSASGFTSVDADTTATTGTHTYTRTGLTNGTLYTFQVRAVTNFGGSETTGAYATITATPNGPITLVSNASQATRTSGSTHFLAQSFRTGTNTSGYTVSEVQIYLTDITDPTGLIDRATNVKIRSDNNGAPGYEVALLTNPESFTDFAFNTFTAPADATVLRGNRTYWISVNEGISSNRMTYGSTSGTGQTGATGWSIADGRIYRASESASWINDTVIMKITVKGTVNPPDTTAPTVTSIERQSPTSSPTNVDSSLTWRVTFNEETQNVDATDFSVSGATATLAVSAVYGAADAYDVTASGNLAGLNTTVTLSIASGHNIQDTSSNALTNTTPTGTNDNTYVVDNARPGVGLVTFSVDGTYAEILFEENMDRSNLPPASAFTVTADGIALTVTGVSGQTSEPTRIWVTVSPAVSVRQIVIVSYTDPTTGDDANALQDAAGNDAASFATSSGRIPDINNYSTVPDTIAPLFASAAADGTSLVITFTENLGAAASLANSAFTVKKTPHRGTAETVTLSTTVAPAISGKTVTLTLATALVGTDTDVKVSYTKPTTGTANKLVDAATNAMDDFANKAVINKLFDTTAPTVTSIERHSPPTSSPTNADSLTWWVTFSEAMQNVDATDFSVSGTTATLAVSAVSGATGTYDVTASGGDLAGLNTAVTLSIISGHNIQDPSSNPLTNTTPMGTNDNTYVVDNAGPAVTSATVESDGMSITIVFSEVLDVPTSTSEIATFINTLKSSFSLIATGRPVTIGGHVATSRNDTIKYAISPTINQGQSVVLSYYDPTSGNDTVAIQDSLGNETASFTTGSDGVPAVTNNSTVDKTGPAVTSATVESDGMSITIVFSEVLDVPTSTSEIATFINTLKSSFSLIAAGRPVTIGGHVATSRNDTIKYAISPTIGQSYSVVLSYYHPTSGNDTVAIQDSLGNETASFTTGSDGVPAVTNNSTVDKTGPELTSATVSPAGTIIQLRFSENLDESTTNASPASAYSVTADGIGVRISHVARGVSGREKLIYVSTLIARGQAVVLSYTDPTAGGDTSVLQDAAGNDAASFTTGSRGIPVVTNNSTFVDSTGPKFASAAVNGASLVITFTENLAAADSLANSAFTVKKTPHRGTEETVTLSATAPVISGKTVTLTLSAAPATTDSLRVTYTKPTSGTANKLIDAYRNQVATFTFVLWGSSHEIPGQDFAHSADTLGLVSVARPSTGRLTYPADGDPSADYGDSGWGDMFNLVGLEASKTYRVEVDFIRVANTVGGNIQLYNCCRNGRLYPVDKWDSNYDGRAIFDFNTGWGESGNSRFVSIIPSNSMNPDVWEFGDYTVTLTDVTGLTQLVTNTSQRPTTVIYAKVGKNTDLHATDKTQLATSFMTSGHTDGYTLDRITAYIERTITGSTVTGVPKAAIHNNATGNLPGAKLCDLQSLADYETGLNLSNGDWPDRLYAPDCANNTLSASKTYWVVFSEDSSPAQTYFVGEADSDAQDPHGASGWSIGDTYYRKTGGNAWVSAGLFPLAIGVYGTPK